MSTNRDDEIIRLRNQGRTLVSIGEEVGLTRERVRQILQDQGLRTMTAQERLDAAIFAWRASGQLKHPADVVEEYGLANHAGTIAKLRRACPELALPDGKLGGSRWDKHGVAEILRRIAGEQGVDLKTGWMKIAEYGMWKKDDDPSTATIGANYLWSEVMELAGFDPKNANKRGRQPGVRYTGFTDDDLDEAVMAYFQSNPTKLTAAGLERFLEANPAMPSMATIRNRFRKHGIPNIRGIFDDVLSRYTPTEGDIAELKAPPKLSFSG